MVTGHRSLYVRVRAESISKRKRKQVKCDGVHTGIPLQYGKNEKWFLEARKQFTIKSMPHACGIPHKVCTTVIVATTNQAQQTSTAKSGRVKMQHRKRCDDKRMKPIKEKGIKRKTYESKIYGIFSASVHFWMAKRMCAFSVWRYTARNEGEQNIRCEHSRTNDASCLGQRINGDDYGVDALFYEGKKNVHFILPSKNRLTHKLITVSICDNPKKWQSVAKNLSQSRMHVRNVV